MLENIEQNTFVRFVRAGDEIIIGKNSDENHKELVVRGFGDKYGDLFKNSVEVIKENLIRKTKGRVDMGFLMVYENNVFINSNSSTFNLPKMPEARIETVKGLKERYPDRVFIIGSLE